MSGHYPQLVFANPRALPDAARLQGRVVVLDIAFAADGMGTPYAQVTQPFLTGLGDRLAAWVDHHDHDMHAAFANDSRFVLATKSQHGACPEMVTPELVERTGPIDTIVTHLDLDGLYAAAKWIRGGREPYAGADDDARCVDTRVGTPSATGRLVDHALRARFRDESLKHVIVRWLVGGAVDKGHRAVIADAAREFSHMNKETVRLEKTYQVRGFIALCDARQAQGAYDKTELLLLGQMRAPVAMVRDAGNVTVAAAYDSGWDFVSLLGLGGGMPTRVSLPDARLGEAIEVINGAAVPRGTRST